MAPYTTIRDGNWSNVTAGVTPWDPTPPAGHPTAGDHVTITHAVKMDGTDGTPGVASIGDAGANHSVVIGAGGRLWWPTNADATLTCSGSHATTTWYAINILSGGILELGAAGATIDSSHKATLILAGTNGGQRRVMLTTSGEVRLFGYPNYRVERTTIAANVTAANPATIQTTDAQDWVANDWITIGTGANKLTAPTEYERVQIVARTDSTHFTAHTLYNHVAGDVMINEERNVIVSGNAAAGGFGITASNIVIDSSSYVLTMYLRASWAKFPFFGCSQQTTALVFNLTGTASTNWSVPAGHLLIEHCAFAVPYATNGRGISVATGTANGYFPVLDSSTALASNHFSFGPSGSGILINPYGDVWTLNDWTFIGLGGTCINGTGGNPRLIVNNLWVSGDSTRNVLAIYSGMCLQISNSKFYACKGVCLGQHTASYMGKFELNTISNCKFYHMASFYGAIYVIGISEISETICNFYISDCEIYDCSQVAIYFNLSGGERIFERCTVDKAGFNAIGGFPIILALCWGTTKFISCDFGITVQNVRKNFEISALSSSDVYDHPHRLILEKCRFREPSTFTWAAAGDACWNDTLGFMVQDYGRTMNQWRQRYQFPDTYSVEFIGCEVYATADVGLTTDLFQVLYPGVTRWGLVGGGGSEMMNEPTTIIDGTLAMKFVPYNCAVRSVFNKWRSIKFSVASGQTVTVKVSLRKHLTQATGRRPRVHLEGCGINTYSEMTDVNDAWEEQTVTGVATHRGDVRLWFSGISEWAAASGTVSDPYDPAYSPATLGTYYFYADGFTVSIT